MKSNVHALAYGYIVWGECGIHLQTIMIVDPVETLRYFSI